jgi:hypothetical protein
MFAASVKTINIRAPHRNRSIEQRDGTPRPIIIHLIHGFFLGSPENCETWN